MSDSMFAEQGLEAIKVLISTHSDNNQLNQNSYNINNTTMTSVERYKQEWNYLLHILENNFEHLRDLAFRGELKVSKFRSIYWALLLRVINADYNTWRDQRQLQRKRYEKLKQEFVKNPYDTEAADDDPLSQSQQSVWNQYFSDQELFAVIKQDVIRTFPGVDFFRKTLIQTAMSNILFYYAREHPYMCYRQGMHEILAPILFVIYGDHQSLLHFKEISKDEIDEVLMDVLNPTFLEADSYSIFSRLMSSIESYYRITNLIPAPGGYLPLHVDSTSMTTEVEVIGQLNSIRDKILAKEDLHLHNYLLKLDIPLHIFGIRWLRLLFGREFPLLDLLMLWDAIFADSDRFDLPNFILVAMLIRIRDKLLLNDYTTCLTYLMRYPSNLDINLILRHALHMQMPKKFDRPENAFIYLNPDAAGSDNRSLYQTTNQKTTANASKSIRSRFLSTNESKKSNPDKQRNRSTSLDGDGINFDNESNGAKGVNASDSALVARVKLVNETNRVINDNYFQNHAELLQLELRNAQTIIGLSRNKLKKYLEILQKNISKHKSDELTQAINGIEELCYLLDVKLMFPLHPAPTQIDEALEANELQRQTNRNVLKTTYNATGNSNHIATFSTGSSVNRYEANTENANESKKEDSGVFRKNSGTIYEKPDTGFMINSFRVLGNRKEVELMQIDVDDNTAVKPRTFGVPTIDPLRHREE